MSILTQDIIDRVRQALDAEEATTNPQLGYYNDATDIIPNIDNAIKWLVATVSSILEEKKFTSELFNELIFTRVFQTSAYSRLGFDKNVLGHEVWTILAVYPEPTLLPATPTPTPSAPARSFYRTDITFLTGTKSAKRLTIGEWNKNAGNPFQDGNLVFTKQNCPDFVSYAYLNAANYISSVYTGLSVNQEIEIRPQVITDFVAVSYVATPTKPTSGASLLQFPESAANLIYEKTLNLIATKIGDKTTVNSKTDEELSEQLKAIV